MKDFIRCKRCGEEIEIPRKVWNFLYKHGYGQEKFFQLFQRKERGV